LSDEISVREYKAGDEEIIVDYLLDEFESWRELPSPLDYWKWKYANSPLKRTIVTLALMNNDIIGFNHSCIINIKIGERTLPSDLNGPALVRPDYRGRGVYTKIATFHDSYRDKYDVCFSFWHSENPIFTNPKRRVDFSLFPHNILEMIRVKDINLHLNMMKSSNSMLKASMFRTVKGVYQITSSLQKIKKKGNFELNTAQKFDDRVNKFWEIMKDNYGFIIERNRDYLNWRYIDIEGKTYRVRTVEDGEILGYSVLETKNSGNYRTGNLLELSYLPERLDVAEALINDVCLFLDENDVNIVRCWVIDGQVTKKLLQKNGFVNNRLYKPFIGCEFLGKKGDLNEIKSLSPDHVKIQLGDVLY
jgi:hypothetical protein